MNPPSTTPTLLAVSDLHVDIRTHGGVIQAVRGVDFTLHKGEVLGIVGESGCGKSVTMQSIMGLLPCPPARITRGSVLYKGRDLLSMGESELRRLRGSEVGMIFQDPMTALNPTMRIIHQIAEVLIVHKGKSQASANREAIRLLDRMRIPGAGQRAWRYPFEFSGGMLQRVMIAIGMACHPSILIADEPTTALDVTTQAQILDLLLELRREDGMSIILITHDLGVIARMADTVCVMYAGQVVENAAVEKLFATPAHPYTVGLRAALPSSYSTSEARLSPIKGTPPDLFDPPRACAYAARCPQAMQVCTTMPPDFFTLTDQQASRCWLHHDHAPEAARRAFASSRKQAAQS